MKKILYVIALGTFGITTTEFGVIGILPQIARAFKITISEAGWLLSVFALIVAVSAPFITIAFSKADKKITLLVVLATFSISNILSAVAPSFSFLLFARALPAFLHPVFWSIGLATAAASVPKEQSPTAVSIVFGGLTVATVLGVSMATFMADLFTWRAAFLLSATINVFSFILLWIFLPLIPKSTNEVKVAYWKILNNNRLLLSILLSCLIISAMYATYGYMADYLKNVTKLNGAEISLMLLLFGITGVGGNYLAGKLLSFNISKTTILFIASLLGIHFLIYLFGYNFNLMIIIIALWGFIHAGGFIISNVNITSATSDAPEFINSIFTSCGNLAVTIGTFTGGLTIAKYDIQHVVWMTVILLLLAAIVWVLKNKSKSIIVRN